MASHFKRCHRNNAQISVAVAAAAEIIGSNADLIEEILRRLPVKSLLRFRSVSKPWLFLISSRRFSLLHWLQQQHPQFHDPKISGLFLSARYSPEFIKYIPLIHTDLKKNRCNSLTSINNGGDENKSLPLLFPDMIIEDSRYGLLLICCETKQANYCIRKSYHVYNPTTKQFSTLPWPFTPSPSYPPQYLYLVFDPLKSLHYKVVLLRSSVYYGCYLCEVHIYSSETHAWRGPQPNIGDHHHPFKAPLTMKLDSGVYCNGSIHWISFSPPPQDTSLYFDVDQERFYPMPSPPYQPDTFKSWHFVESRGHLHLIEYNDGTGFNFDISEMESDHSKWSLKYRFSLDSMMVDLASKQEMVVRPDTVSVLGLIHGEDDGDVFLVLFVDTTMIISYNIKDNTLKKVDHVSSLPKVSYPEPKPKWRVNRYIENIFPV